MIFRIRKKGGDALGRQRKGELSGFSKGERTMVGDRGRREARGDEGDDDLPNIRGEPWGGGRPFL